MANHIGIVGGGQLAAFLVIEALEQGSGVTVLDPEPRCPAALKGAKMLTGPMHDETLLLELAACSDVITVDLENVNVDALAKIASAGTEVTPQPKLLRTLTNKLTQKQALQAASIPTSQFVPFDGKDVSIVPSLGWPAVNKAATGGYDGRGVAILRGPDEVDKVLPVPGFIEAFVEHRMEIAVMVARNHDGETLTYAPVEMAFNPDGNLLDYLIAPARIDASLATEAEALARKTIDAIDGVGIFGVEMFLTPENRILVNEISPRTHNSGHYTMDACQTSQFAQQYRILTHQPLGDCHQHSAAVMFNLLGEPGYEGETIVEGLDEIHIDNVRPYLYGKHECFALRKMGHVTITAPTVDEALTTMAKVRPLIRVRGANRIV